MLLHEMPCECLDFPLDPGVGEGAVDRPHGVPASGHPCDQGILEGERLSVDMHDIIVMGSHKFPECNEMPDFCFLPCSFCWHPFDLVAGLFQCVSERSPDFSGRHHAALACLLPVRICIADHHLRPGRMQLM